MAAHAAFAGRVLDQQRDNKAKLELEQLPAWRPTVRGTDSGLGQGGLSPSGGEGNANDGSRAREAATCIKYVRSMDCNLLAFPSAHY